MNTTTRPETTALVAAQESQAQLPAQTNSAALILDPTLFQQMMAVAEVMAVGMATVPQHLRKNKGDCLAVVMQATQWRMNPFAVAQKTHVVNGTLGYEGQLVNAVINTMSPTKDRLNYEWFGQWEKVIGKFVERTSKKKVDEDTGEPLKYRAPNWTLEDEQGLGIRVWATMKGEDKPRELVLLLAQCRVRNSPLWADDPRQQIAYLAVKRWSRLHCPDVLLGVYTPDELQEVGTAREIDPDSGEIKPAAPKFYAQEHFDANLPAWTKAVATGKATPDGVITRVESGGVPLTEDQKKVIRALKKAEDAQPKGEAPKFTYAQVADQLKDAKDLDALALAADLIKTLPADQQEALNKLHDDRRAALAA